MNDETQVTEICCSQHLKGCLNDGDTKTKTDSEPLWLIMLKLMLPDEGLF